jgi:hypothetical protein
MDVEGIIEFTLLALQSPGLTIPRQDQSPGAGGSVSNCEMNVFSSHIFKKPWTLKHRSVILYACSS